MKYLFSHLFSKVDVFSLACDVCIKAKQHRVSLPSQPYKPTRPFTLVHNDVCDLYWWPYSSYLGFPDLRQIWSYLHIPRLLSHHRNAIQCKSDNGREFQNHSLNEFLSSKGIVHQSSCAYTPNKTGLPNKKIVTFWKLLVPLCCPLLFLPISGVMSFSLPLISSTACLLVSFTSRHRKIAPKNLIPPLVLSLMFSFGCSDALPMSIAMVRTKLNLPLGSGLALRLFMERLWKYLP